LAVFGSEEKDAKSGFTIAPYAVPVSKDLGQEDVFVTPIKVSSKPKFLKNPRSNKKYYIDANVLDSKGIKVDSLNMLRATAMNVLDPKCKTSLGFDGRRGFMVRISHPQADGNIQSSAWEFFGQDSSQASQTWNFHWKRKPLNGQRDNVLKAVLTAANAAFSDSNSYVEVVGISKVLINDFGSDEKVLELAKSPNYKTDFHNKEMESYSLAALSVQKHKSKRIIKQQIALPRNKIVNNRAGLLGNQHPGQSQEVKIEALKVKQTTNNAPSNLKQSNSTGSRTSFPLVIEDYVNSAGEVNSFHIKGSSKDLKEHEQRILSAANGIRPFIAKGTYAYSFPYSRKQEVASNLYDLLGSNPLYIEKIEYKGKPYLTLKGNLRNETNRVFYENIVAQHAAFIADSRPYFESNKGVVLAQYLENINPTKTSSLAKNPTHSTDSDEATVNISDNEKTVSFSDWLEDKFGKSAYEMMNYLSSEIEAAASQAGIDWYSSKDSMVLNQPGTESQLIKGRSSVYPIDRGHLGSVAMNGEIKEKRSTTQNGNSIKWFSLLFLNKAAYSSKSDYSHKVVYDAYPDLKAAYDRDVHNHTSPKLSNENRKRIEKEAKERAENALKRKNEQRLRDEKSRQYWARTFPTLKKEDGKDGYLNAKNARALCNVMDLRIGYGKNSNRFTMFQLEDKSENIVGAQRIYKTGWADDKGRFTNKVFIPGTLFKDPETGVSLGTHAKVGNINADKPIIFVEGLADSSTAYKATGYPVVICLSKDNMYEVVADYRNKYPDRRFIIASDNDSYNRKKGNIGFVSCLDTSREFDCDYIIPSFIGMDINSKPTDFNDLESLAGLETVRSQFLDVKKPPSDLLEFHKLRAKVIGLNKLKSHIESAVEQVLEAGTHGIDKQQIQKTLVVSAILAYSREEVKEALGAEFDTIDLSNNNSQILSSGPIVSKKKPEIECLTKTNESTGKKYCLVVDNTNGKNEELIKGILNYIVGEKYVRYNEHLGGWLAPYPTIKLINTFLHDKTNAPRLYLGKSRSKTSSHYVIRGDFSDSTFKSEIEDKIAYANPQYNLREYGFVLPDSDSVRFVRESLKGHLSSDINFEFENAIPPIVLPEVDQNELNSAQRFSGISKGEIVMAHCLAQFGSPYNLVLHDDFIFSSIYAKSRKSLSHLKAGALHEKALADAILKAKNLLDAGVLTTAIDQKSEYRLKHIVAYWEFLNSENTQQLKNHIYKEAVSLYPEQESAIVEIIDGKKPSRISEDYEVIVGDIQEIIFEQSDAEIDQKIQTVVAVPEFENEPNTVNEHQGQEARAKQLLEIVEIAIHKGFNEEELHDLFITQNGSPYFDRDTDTFDNVTYRRDLRYLSGTTDIASWTPKTITTTSQLYYAIYDEVASNRVHELERYISSYLGEKGVTTYKTFDKYLKGKYELACKASHLYLSDGEIDDQLIKTDLEYVTGQTSLNELYKTMSLAFETGAETQSQNTLFDEDNKQSDNNGSRVVFSEGSSELEGIIREHVVKGSDIYEISIVDQLNKQHLKTLFNVEQKQAEEHLLKIISNGKAELTKSTAEVFQGAVSTQLIDTQSSSNNTFYLYEADYGKDVFFYVRKDEPELSNAEVVIAEDIVNARQMMGVSENNKRPIYSGVEEKISVLETSAKPKIEMSEFFKASARESVDFEHVLNKLKSDYDVVFPSDRLGDIQKQYEQLVSKYKPSEEDSNVPETTSRYKVLYSSTLDVVNSEMTFDEYLEEYFTVDGSYIVNNPYWSEDKNQVDRKHAFDDIRAAGFKSLSHFYESLFDSVHHRKSNEMILSRAGGYIPARFDTKAELKPQFESLISLLGQNQPEASMIKRNIPLFRDWAESLDAYNLSHPILSENILEVDAKHLTNKYDNDALLLLADIHGIKISVDGDPSMIANKVVDTWKTRVQISSISKDELKELRNEDLVDIMESLELPGIGSKREKIDKIRERVEQLKRYSKLRIAEYSYIQKAAEIESAGLRLPKYVKRCINEFISNEIAFADSVEVALDRTEDAYKRNRISNDVSLVNSISTLSREAFNVKENKNVEIIGATDTDYIKPGVYKYYINSEETVSDLVMPSSITYYSKYTDKIFSTNVALENEYLESNNLAPVSNEAVLNCLSSLGPWLERKGHACFSTENPELRYVITKSESGFQCVRLNGLKLEEVNSYKNISQLISEKYNELASFEDRESLVDEWLRNSHKVLENVIRPYDALLENNKDIDQQALQSIASHPAINDQINSESKDVEFDQVLSAITEYKNRLYKATWSDVLENKFDINGNHLLQAVDFAKLLNDSTDVSSNEPVNDDLWRLSPNEATILFQQYVDSDKQKNRNLFNSLYQEHYHCLNDKEKNELSIDIASGSYRSIGHYLHYCALSAAIEAKTPEATKQKNLFYPEPIQLDEFPVDDSVPETQKHILVMSESYKNGFAFGKVQSIEKDSISFTPNDSLSISLDTKTLPADVREKLYCKDGDYIPAMTLEQFCTKPESTKAPYTYFELNPATADGFQEVTKLKLNELRKYAGAFGIDTSLDREQALLRLRATLKVREICSRLTNSDSELSAEEKVYIQSNIDILANEDITKSKLLSWNDSTTKYIHQYIAKENMKNIVDLASKNGLVLSRNNEVGLELATINPNSTRHYIYSGPANPISTNVNDLATLAKLLNSDNKIEVINAHYLLDRLQLSRQEVESSIARIPNGFKVMFKTKDNETHWIPKNSEGLHLDNKNMTDLNLCLAALDDNSDLSTIEENTKEVAFLSKQGLLQFGYCVVDEGNTKSKITIKYQDDYGNNKVIDISQEECLFKSEADIEKQLNQIMEEFIGSPGELIERLEANSLDSQNLSEQSRKIELLWMLQLVGPLKERIDKFNRQLERNQEIHISGGKYYAAEAKSTANNGIDEDLHDSPEELVKALKAKKRALANMEKENDANQSDRIQGSGLLRSESSSDDSKAEIRRQLGDNVVQITGANRATDGDNDDPPPGPGGGNGKVPRKSSEPTDPKDGRATPGSPTSSTRTRRINFSLPDNIEQDVSVRESIRIKNNLEALAVRKELVGAGKRPNEEQQITLSKYTGWGGLSSIFSSKSSYGHSSINNSDYKTLLELVTDDELKSIKQSTLTAFYTPHSILSSMWKIVTDLGYSNGNILDPSAGIASAFGMAPDKLKKSGNFLGVELEPVSAQIAQLIYGEEQVKHCGYEKLKLPSNYFDIALSNIPFGDISIYDKEFRSSNLKIHDYFFIKTVDKLVPGGMLAFITSTGTLDKADSSIRKKLYETADLLGAIRLPRNTFYKIAGTSVDADIVVMRKRVPGEEPLSNNWLTSKKHSFQSRFGSNMEVVRCNQYFVDNPEMVIGELSATRGPFGVELGTFYSENVPISEQIEKCGKNITKSFNFDHIHSDIENQQQIHIDFIEESQLASNRTDSFIEKDNQIGFIRSEFDTQNNEYRYSFVPQKYNRTDYEKMRGMIEIRNATREIINIQLAPYDNANLHAAQARLNFLYDTFSKSYGCLNDKGNAKLFRNDPDSSLLLALENYNLESNTATKTDIFSKRTIATNRLPEKANSAEEGLSLSLKSRGLIDLDYISKIASIPRSKIESKLKDRIFKNPESNQWEIREKYLSGNVKYKLEHAKAAAEIDDSFIRNVRALESVFPAKIPSYDIAARLGATWIPESYIQDFIGHIVTNEELAVDKRTTINVSRFDAKWNLDVSPVLLSKNEGQVTKTWGTDRANATVLIEKLLNNRQIVIKDKGNDGQSWVNQEETVAANLKAELISNEFKEWLWSDSERSEILETIYNDLYNVYVEPKYSGDSVHFHGLTPTLNGAELIPRQSQKSAIERYLLEGRTLNAHPVGSGKTLELIGSAMEGKRIGVHSKAMIVVPNNILSQFGLMATELYPNARALILEPKDLVKDSRKLFTAKVATGDWDMVVIANSSFKKIATPLEHQRAIIEDEKFSLLEALERDSEKDDKSSRITVKQIERSLKKLETKIEALLGDIRRDDFLYLDEMGVDAIFVDEADNYLNLQTATSMGHIPGVNTSASQQSMNMYMAVRYIQKLNGDNKGVIFATGTDVRNSMSDMYTMLRYVAPDVLEKSNAESFDSFINTFGEVVKTIEIKPEGTGYREQARLSKFVNVPEMVMMYRQVADVLVADQMNLNTPELEKINVKIESNPWLQLFMKELSERAINVRSGSVSKTEDNLLKISTDGRLASLDLRLIDTRVPDIETSKVNTCVENVLNEWQSGNENRLTQIVFCDLGTPNKERFSVYDDIKEKLLSKGVPEHDIAFSQDFKTEKQKKQRDQDINNGKIRIVIASAETLGVGTNVQERLVAIHNLTAPWRPRELEQMLGRMVRPGNINKHVRNYTYGTEDSFDLFTWQCLKRKAEFIKQTKVDPRNATREIEENIDPTYAEIMAITSGNPLIKRKIQLESDIDKLVIYERNFKRSQHSTNQTIRSHEYAIQELESRIVENNQLLQKVTSNNSRIKIAGHFCPDAKQAAKIVNQLVGSSKKPTEMSKTEKIELGTVGDTPIYLSWSRLNSSWRLMLDDGKPRLISDYKKPSRMMQELFGLAAKISVSTQSLLEQISEKESAISSLRTSLSNTFPKAMELKELKQEHATVQSELSKAADEAEENIPENATTFQQELKSLTQRAIGMR